MKNQNLKTTIFIHFALLLGMVTFFGITLLLNKNELNTEFSFENTFTLVGFFIIAYSLFLHIFLFKKQIKKIKNISDFSEKMKSYQGALILKWAFIEGAVIYCIVATLITKNVFLLSIAAVLMIYFYTLKPSKEKAIADLELSREEKQQIEN